MWNRRNLFTYTDGVQITKGIHQISAGVWFQRVQDNEDTASRQLGLATFASLTTFLQGTLTNFQVVPNHNELGWRSLFGAWYVEDAIKLRRNLTLQVGIRHEFTTGWNEVSGKGRQLHHGRHGRAADRSARRQIRRSRENNAKRLFSPRIGLAWDPFGNGKTAVRAGFGTYYSLIDALSFLLNSLPPYNGSLAFTGSLPSLLPITPERAGASLLRPGRARRPARPMRRRACRPTRRRPPSRSGISPCEQQLRPQYGSARGLRRIARISRTAQHRSQHHSGADLRQRGGCTAGGTRHRQELPCRRARSTFPWRRAGRIRICPRASSGLPKATAATTRCNWTSRGA